jgi:hypothetical protein
MTWVFGSPTILGSGLCVADVQVTTGDGELFDCLRKLYLMDRNLIAGFAGDVAAGFGMLTALHHLMRKQKRPGDDVADVRRIFQDFPTVAGRAFSALPPLNREAGSQVLIVGANHAPDALYGSRPVAARFLAPDFSCDEIGPGEWGSIGSGAEIEDYCQELEVLTSDEGRKLMQLEANSPGGYAKVMSFSVVQAIRRMPSVPGISRHFHTGVVFANGSEIGTSDATWYDGAGAHDVRMPEVADSFASMQALLTRLRGTAVSGVAVA